MKCMVQVALKKRILKHHILLVHRAQKSFSYEVCKSRFTLKQTFNKHVRLVHNENKNFTCNTFHSSKTILNIHISTIHEEKEKILARFAKLS